MLNHLKLLTIANVEVWQNFYLNVDYQLPDATKQEIVRPKSEAEIRAMRGNYGKEGPEYRAKHLVPIQKLTFAISTAPVMVQVTVDALKALLAAAKSGAPASAELAAKHQETVYALYKYFNLPADLMARAPGDPNWEVVGKILKLYEQTLNGLRGDYRLYLFEPKPGSKENAHGFVKYNPEAAHPLDAYFNTRPDENGHVPYPEHLAAGMERGQIHLSMVALRDAQKDQTKTAHLLLHEATHKFAQTKDILYKNQTFAQKHKANWDLDQSKWTGNPKSLQYAIQDKEQPTLARPGQAKPLLPMAGKEGGKLVAASQWIYNADSYAWAARRLWKRATNRGADAYGAA